MALKLSLFNPYLGEEVESYSIIKVEIDKFSRKATYRIKSFDSQEVRNMADTDKRIKPFAEETMETIDFDTFYADSLEFGSLAAAYIDAKKSRTRERTIYVNEHEDENGNTVSEPQIISEELNKWVNAQDC